MPSQVKERAFHIDGAQQGELLTLRQASRLLKVHPNTLRNWERAGLIPVVRVGPRRDRRFAKHIIDGFQVGKKLEQLSGATAQLPLSATKADAGDDATRVVLNLPTALSGKWLKVMLAVVAVGAAVVFFVPVTDTNSLAIRRNPPQTLFADDFEVYEIGSLPRPTWNTIGVWEIVKEGGQRFLRGTEKVDNPLNVLSHVYTGSSGWKDYKFKFDARIVEGDQSITALIDYLDERNYYAVKFTVDSLSITLVKEGKEQILGSAPIPEGHQWTAGWQTYAVDLFGESVDILHDGERVLGVDSAGLTSGKVGFLIRRQTVDFDHVQILESSADVRSE